MKGRIPDPYNPPVREGVYKPNANFPGTDRVEVVDSNGELMFFGLARAGVIDEAMEKALRRILQRKDTGFKLRVVS